MSALFPSAAPATGAALTDAYLRLGAPPTTTDADDLAAFCRWLAARRPDGSLDAALRAFGADDLEAFIADQLRGRRVRRLDPSTVYRRLLALGRFYAWAAALGAVAASPVPPERTARATPPRAGAAG